MLKVGFESKNSHLSNLCKHIVTDQRACKEDLFIHVVSRLCKSRI